MLRTVTLLSLLVCLPLQSWAGAGGPVCKVMAFASAVQALDHGDPSHADGHVHHDSQAGAADHDCGQCGICHLAHSSALPVQPADLSVPDAGGYAPAPRIRYFPFCPDPSPRPPLFTLA